MCIAAQSGHKECVEVLAGLGGDVNRADTVSVEGAAQFVVGVHGSVQHVELDDMVFGVDANHVAVGGRGCVKNGATPMLIAAVNGHKECIEVLAALGGDVNKAETVSVEGVAQSAVVAWWWRVPQQFELGAMVLDIDVCDVTVGVCGCVQNGATPIYAAAVNGNKECIEVLAGLGGDVNQAYSVSVERAAQSFVGAHDGA